MMTESQDEPGPKGHITAPKARTTDVREDPDDPWDGFPTEAKLRHIHNGEDDGEDDDDNGHDDLE
jgi:hypothetical protein